MTLVTSHNMLTVATISWFCEQGLILQISTVNVQLPESHAQASSCACFFFLLSAQDF